LDLGPLIEIEKIRQGLMRKLTAKPTLGKLKRALHEKNISFPTVFSTWVAAQAFV
jgi:hypothetical protein